MKNRKRIGVMINNPEDSYQRRIIDGIMLQCERYGYDTVVFSPLVDIWHPQEEYLRSELNIWQLANFDKLDGVLVTSITMTKDKDRSELEKLCNMLREKCKKPVITIDLEAGGFDTVYTDDKPAFREITAHVIDVHGCDPDKIYFLSGQEYYDLANHRIEAFVEELESRGYTPKPENIFHGDFWYGSGHKLADRIASGELPVPQAVICGNDHMAIGLANRLTEHGIKVPDQVIVTGYDATQDAVKNKIVITSFMPNVRAAGEDAVNKLHELISPGEPLIPSDPVKKADICLGSSCGCRGSMNYVRDRFLDTEFSRSIHDYTYGYDFDNIDMSQLMESYMLEQLTASKSPDEAIKNIFDLTYLLRPYGHFYLCLRRDWLNTYRIQRAGYPHVMRTIFHAIPQTDDADRSIPLFCRDDDSHLFETSEMLPQLYLERERPCVFYFAPIHFQGDCLGYCVLQCDLKDRIKLSAVFRNWVRNVNNALEMVRVQNRLISYSLYDSMTGLLNRRGMDIGFRRLLSKAESGQSCAVFVIDMNGLKKINDQYGHSEGDYAIMQLAYCVNAMATDDSFIAVRAGGDEFYVIGIGDITEQLLEDRRTMLFESLERMDREGGKPYKITASVGSCLRPYTEDIKLEELIHSADAIMYINKNEFKRRHPAE